MHRYLLALTVFCVATPVLAGQAPALTGKTRTYYIAADEVTWDYAPSGINQITGEPFQGPETFFAVSAKDRIGRLYKKAIYREYTDATFKTLKPRAADWEHLGILGPLIRAEVGDTIQVVFRNNTAYPFTVHPHGVFYNKDSEGAPYKDGTLAKERKDDGVPPGETHAYVWPVPERAGPAHGDGNSVLWMYHSHKHEEADVNAGLIGPMIVSAPGTTKPDLSPKDVDREFIVLFGEFDENLSWYIDENIKKYTGDPSSVKKPWGPTFIEPFGLSNLKETMNGFIYGHMPGLTTRVGERVRWYLMANTNFEVHAPHWHGNTVVANHMRTDVTPLLPMGMMVADMVPDNPGIWFFHCHTGPHLTAGMQALYTVLPKAGRPSTSSPE
jgi:FtsP/CotA-like multicopper oxidase with cupredoxin domain